MAANARRGICGPCPRRMAANALSGLQNDKTVGRCRHSAARQYAHYSNPADKTIGRCSHSAARQYALYSNPADKTVGRCSHSAARQYAHYSNPADKTVGRCKRSAARQYTLYSRSSPLLAITFLYHQNDFLRLRSSVPLPASSRST